MGGGGGESVLVLEWGVDKLAVCFSSLRHEVGVSDMKVIEMEVMFWNKKIAMECAGSWQERKKQIGGFDEVLENGYLIELCVMKKGLRQCKSGKIKV